MTKLSDTQAILLSTAAQRDTHSILPLPKSVKPSGAGKAIAALITRAFAEERETNDAALSHRTDGDVRYGVFATAAGLAAVGIDLEDISELSARCCQSKANRSPHDAARSMSTAA